MTPRLIVAGAASALAVAGAAVPANSAATLDAITARGTLICGVNSGLTGFSAPDAQGNWTGLDVDYCRALAAALFGDADAVQYVPLTAQQRFTSLQSGQVDILSRNTTWTLTRDTSLGLDFVGVTFYDGQGFMVPAALGVTSALELSGATVCVQTGTTTELNLADYFRANGMELQTVAIEAIDEVNNAYFSGRCDAYTTDASGLASIRSTSAGENPEDHVILPEIISKEPLGPAVRQDDPQFFDIAKWTLFALLEAEEKGITSENVDEFLTSQDPSIARLLGTTPGMGAALGLSEQWAYEIIRQVGNYGEIYARNVGPDTPLLLERGLNAQWTDGGLMYAPPIR